ncbi:MAG: hypothetical protein ACKVKR_08255, partial [Pseudomonadales bacterium]
PLGFKFFHPKTKIWFIMFKLMLSEILFFVIVPIWVPFVEFFYFIFVENPLRYTVSANKPTS